MNKQSNIESLFARLQAAAAVVGNKDPQLDDGKVVVDKDENHQDSISIGASHGKPFLGEEMADAPKVGHLI